MKTIKTISAILFSALMFVSCGALRAPMVQKYEPIEAYKYFYITPTSELVSSSSGVYGNQYGVYGGSSTNSMNPSDVISGVMLKHGYIRLPELNTELLDETLIVNYGESGRRNLNLGYALEVTIQFLSARTRSVVSVCTAEGQGSTEADDLRIAINRALNSLFEGTK